MKHIVKTKTPSGKTRTRVYTKFTLPSKTDQSFKEDCDVNIVLKKFMKTGQLTHVNRKTASYSDVSEVPNLLDAHVQLSEAKKAFMKLPAELRKKLGNNPLALDEYLRDPENLEEAIQYGLLEKRAKPAKEPSKVPEPDNHKAPQPKKDTPQQ